MYLSGLNDKQLEAVTATEGYLRVIAGAGSGKTKLLVSRYAYLVKEYGIDPANILCVTFTNKAAGEMKRRIRSLIGEEYSTSLICTYHGFCVRVLREDIEKLFYPKEFQIIDTSQQKSILGDIYQKYELKLDHASFEKIIGKIGYVKSYLDYVPKMCSTENCQILPEITDLDDKIIEEFLQRQKQIFALDFDDLMFFALKILTTCPEVLSKWQDRLNYIQVDEFQDSSKNEMLLVDLLSGQHKNLMIVGDPDQNIYEWRGSDVKLLVEFDKTHQPTNTVFLNQNYRSTPQILNCANTLIEKNKLRLEKELFTNSASGAEVLHYHSANDFAEADRIIECIQDIRKANSADYSDFAVLYRSGFLSRVIEKKFTENGIPYEIIGGVKFFQRMEVQDIVAYLRLIAFDDDISLKRIINKPRRKFGRTRLQQLVALQAGGKSLYQTLKENLLYSAFRNSGAEEFVSLIESAREKSAEMSLSDAVAMICEDSGYEKYIREQGDMERFENLSEFKRIAMEFEKGYGEEVTLKDFINHISLQAEDDETESDRVKLMTVHAAKGLEFPNVFVVGLSEGIFPSYKSMEERKLLGLEEERRLCYVAITRAEQRLFLMDSEGFTPNGKQKLPSRFLREIGEENFRRIGAISKELQSSADRYAREICGEAAVPQKDVGEKIVHPAFGEGEIVGISGNSYRVKFSKLSSERNISADFVERFRNKGAEPIPKKTEQALPHSELTITEKPPIIVQQLIEPIPEEKIDISVEISEPIPASPEKDERPDLSGYDNLWERDDVPHSGWYCEDVIDLGKPVGVCEMCGYHIIRYVHRMKHNNYGKTIGAGCVCAGRMEGDVEAAKKREQDFKNRQSRRNTFVTRPWKVSKNNNRYIKVNGRLVVLYHDDKRKCWRYSIDKVFGKGSYPTPEAAMEAAFDELDKP
ncbi:MAG: UvrD-helicase domain-containing protein [Oscillospiraceae bacterium]|nr:UvrD-helicase domain-containing protein [Oscillospiraceae bacterium]